MKKNEIEVEIDIQETKEAAVFKFKYCLDSYDLIYHKYKDKVILMKNSKPIDLRSMRKDEKERYKAILEFAVQYCHDFDDEYLKN